MDKRLIAGAFLALAAVVLAPMPPVAAPSPNSPAVSNGSPAPDMLLLEEESKFQREKTEYLQENILDKILGPGKAVVIVDVEMGLETRGMEMLANKKKSDKKPNEGADKEPGVAPPQKFLVPGVPMPKSVFPNTDQPDLGGEAKHTTAQLQQKHLEVRTTIKKLLITILYDRRGPAS